MAIAVRPISIEDGLTVQDRLRLHLNNFGQREIPITVDQLASQMGLNSTSVYQALNRLRINNEIEYEKTNLPNGREKIIGIKVNKLEPSGRTYRRAAEKVSTLHRVVPAENYDLGLLQAPTDRVDQLPDLPVTLEYLKKKLAVERLRKQAIESGLDSESIVFTEDPQAEEAVAVLKMFTDLREAYHSLKNEHQTLEFDYEAEKRNAEEYKKRLREETRQDLLAVASSNGHR